MTHHTQCEITRFLLHFRLAADAEEYIYARMWIEKILTEAVQDGSAKTAETCRKIAADMLTEQRSQIYERMRRVSSC